MLPYAWLRPLLFQLDAETAHRATIAALSTGLLQQTLTPQPHWRCTLWGNQLPHPIGLAAGFDKDAEAIAGIFKLGFSWAEFGTVTPRPQAGQARPRVFRLQEDQAVINRYGFNSRGLDYFVANLRRYRARFGHRQGLLGANIGKNKDSVDAVADYRAGIQATAPYVDYITLNISSPNTPGLRDLQQEEVLNQLLSAARESLQSYAHVKLVLKVAPDLTDDAIGAISAAALRHALDGLIVSNTTLARPTSLASAHSREAGGLSGQPLFDISTAILKKFADTLSGKIPLIAAGGIASAAQAQAKLAAGATALQVYTGLIYRGPQLLQEITATP